ncbi:hypothetical protein Tco_0688385, partial [Tanacetum coccineum]
MTWISKGFRLGIDDNLSLKPNATIRYIGVFLYDHTKTNSPNVATFKYNFWAFGHAINASRLCPPIISVDGAHLKGSYIGKLLVALTKDVNNNILPVAYAIVDNETDHNHALNSPNVATFKYNFWAFGHAINASRLCPPIISVDGAHLKGSYIGKLLVALTKDVNNNILPVAYAIVDNEIDH